MLDKLIKIIVKLVLSAFILYSYNIIAPQNLIVPINIITVSLISLFGFPMLTSLILILYAFY